MAQSAYATSQAGVRLTLNQVKPDQALGQTTQGDGGAEFLYCRFVAATVLGDMVWLDKDHNATKLTTTSSPLSSRVGSARVTSAAINDYGWVQVAGQAPVNIAASAIANTRLNTTATAGRVDDDGTTGAKVIERAIINTTQGGAAGVAEATLSYPTVGATL
jgi:hypothetical protein